MTKEEKRAAILAELANSGVVDLNSLVEKLVEEVSDDWDPESEGTELAGRWFILRPLV